MFDCKTGAIGLRADSTRAVPPFPERARITFRRNGLLRSTPIGRVCTKIDRERLARVHLRHDYPGKNPHSQGKNRLSDVTNPV
jgi:hypothetical protein